MMILWRDNDRQIAKLNKPISKFIEIRFFASLQVNQDCQQTSLNGGNNTPVSWQIDNK